MITKTQAKILYEHYDKMVTKLTEAQVALISGSVKSYKIDDREITRFDLDKLSEQLDAATIKRAEYMELMNGGKSRRAVGVIPRDI